MVYAVERCRDCGRHFDPAFLTDGRCEDCAARNWLLNVKAERD